MTDVDEAQKAIMRIAKKLSDKGELVLAGRDDYVPKATQQLLQKKNLFL